MNNLFYPKNIYGFIVSLSFTKKEKIIIFTNKKIFSDLKNLTKYLSKNLNVKFININNSKEVREYILKKILPKNFSKINFFHKEEDFLNEKLFKKKINSIFLENGIGNYFNFVTQNDFIRIKEKILKKKFDKFESYYGLYSNLGNDIYINGQKVKKLQVKKITNILKMIKKFYQYNNSIKLILNKLNQKKEKILINVPEFLSQKDFKNFLMELIRIKKKKTDLFFKFHPNDYRTNQKMNYIKNLFKNDNVIILKKTFNSVPFELLVSLSQKNIIFSSISNIPFSCSLIFKNLIYVYLPKSINKKYEEFNELNIRSYDFYQKNFKKIQFI